MDQKKFKLEAVKKPKKTSSATASTKTEKKTDKTKSTEVETSSKKEENLAPEKPKRLTKKRLAAMTPEQAAEVTAAAVEARRQARLEKRMQRKAEQEDLNSSLARPRDFSEEEWKPEDSEFKCEDGWIVVLTPKGDIYQEPVSRYCDLSSFIAVVCSLPSISADSHLRMESIINRSPFDYGEIVTATYLGATTRNNFAKHFNLQGEPKTASGNIVFSGKNNKAFTPKQAQQVVKWVIRQIGAEEEVDTT